MTSATNGVDAEGGGGRAAEERPSPQPARRTRLPRTHALTEFRYVPTDAGWAAAGYLLAPRPVYALLVALPVHEDQKTLENMKSEAVL